MRPRIILSFASAVLTVAVVEAALRMSDSGYLNAPSISDRVLHHVHPRNYRFRSYDPGGEFDGHMIRYDAGGLTVDPSSGNAPADAGVRLAVLGDSFVEAVQVPFDQSLVGRLARAMAGRAVLRDYGVTGYSPILYYLQWTAQVRAWHPALVLVLLYSNDVDDDREYGKVATYDAAGLPTAVPGPPDNPIVLMLHHSYAARLSSLAYRRLFWWWTHRHLTSATVGGFVETNPDISPLTGSLLTALAAEVRAGGADIVLSAVPSKARLAGVPEAMKGPQFSDKVGSWAATRGVRFIDLVPAFAQAAAAGRQLFFHRDIHLTAEGHAVAARTICGAFATLCDSSR